MAANILVVDDSGTMRGMIKRMLTISGLDVGEVYEAGNGIEALAQMHAQRISVVLLDINMPVMNGVKLIRRIHDDPRLRDMPVIVASTDGGEPRIQELLAAGARGYLRKPFRPEHLRDVLAPLVGLRAQPTTGAAQSDDLSF